MRNQITQFIKNLESKDSKKEKVMKRILFVGDDLFNNGQEKINEMKARGYMDEKDIFECSKRLLEVKDGIYFISDDASEIVALPIQGKVCRTYVDFLEEISNLDNYDHVVVDLNFESGGKEAKQELLDYIGNADLYVLQETKARVRDYALRGCSAEDFIRGSEIKSFGVLVIKQLQEMGKSFTIFTRDAAHATRAFILLANAYQNKQEIVEFINSIDKFDNMKYDGEFLSFSVSKKIAAGTKHLLLTWQKFLKEIL